LVSVDGCWFVLFSYLWIVLEELFLPFAEGFRQLLVVLFTHHVFLNSFKALNLLVDRGRVHIIDIEHHPTLSPIGPKRAHILIQIGDQIALDIFELQLQEGHK
jgi:hypothetical protein